jgi:hypothetical protein
LRPRTRLSRPPRPRSRAHPPLSQHTTGRRVTSPNSPFTSPAMQLSVVRSQQGLSRLFCSPSMRRSTV